MSETQTAPMTEERLREIEHDAAKLRNRWTYDGQDRGEEMDLEPGVESEDGDTDPVLWAGGMEAITVHQDGGVNGLDVDAANEVARVIARAGGNLFDLVAEARALRAALYFDAPHGPVCRCCKMQRGHADYCDYIRSLSAPLPTDGEG